MSEEINKTAKRPDDLLEGIGKSIMTKALVYSIIGHIILTGATSISLFKDWTVYGVKSPSAINAIRTAENRKAEEEARRKKAAERAEAEAKAEAEAAANAANAAKAGGPRSAAAADPKAVSADAAKKTPPEVQPLPPKKEFQYGDDLSLD